MNQTIVAAATTLSIAQIKIAAAIANLGIDIQMTKVLRKQYLLIQQGITSDQEMP